MKNETKHTPRISIGIDKTQGEGHGQRKFLLIDEGIGGQEAIGEIYTDSKFYQGRMEKIVRAVNAHDELVEIIKTVQRIAFQRGTTELMRRCKDVLAGLEGK